MLGEKTACHMQNTTQQHMSMTWRHFYSVGDSKRMKVQWVKHPWRQNRCVENNISNAHRTIIMSTSSISKVASRLHSPCKNSSVALIVIMPCLSNHNIDCWMSTGTFEESP